jgi:hypothetical protein
MSNKRKTFINYKNINKRLSKSNRIEVLEKLFTIQPDLVDHLEIPLKQIIYLSFGKIRGLSSRFTMAKKFILHLVWMKEHHGADFTIK